MGIVPTIPAVDPFRISFTVPIRCLTRDEWLHRTDLQRSCELMAREGQALVITLACGCPFFGLVFQK